tara:strand:+ start:253 stop:636 length:384 start_codon:yes stop_codon:yes gene_type:complete
VYVTDLQSGDRILISLVSSSPAYPTRTNTEGSIVYKTGRKYKKHELTFLKGTATILSNISNVLTFRFADFYNPTTSGIAAVDYKSISSIYLYEGETNASTVAQGLNDPTTAPAVDIYRNKVILRWTE